MKKIFLVLSLVLLLQLALVPASQAAPPQSGGYAFHVVRYGETLSSIAYRYGTSVHAIAKANGIVNPNLIFAGTVLKIPAYSPYPPPGYGCSSYHYVGYGQTLYSIGRWYGISPWKIASANGIYNLNYIYAGQRLCIPY
jgi:LysM repeat protein